MRVRGTGCLFLPQYRDRNGKVKTAGIWHWKAPSGQRYTTGHRDKKGAQSWALARLAEMHGSSEARGATYDDVERVLIGDWTVKGRRSLPQAYARLRRLRRAFSGWSTGAITTDRVMGYAVTRLGEGAAPGTVNLSIALLHRGFVLAKRAGLVKDVPIMDRLKTPPPRRGTIDRGDFEAILETIPARYVPLLRFLHATGWREGEGLSLRWDWVDDHEVHLDPLKSKTGKPRSFPYRASPPLTALLETQRQARGFSCYVFPGRAGHPIDRTALQKAWRRACVKVGLPAALIHDLRRTAARDLRRAGVAPYVAMAQLGHVDTETHQNYSVVLAEDLAEAVRRLEVLRAAEPVKRSVVRLG